MERKYFLDWLRVAAFGMLILFHVGLLYAPWDFNLKSPRLLPSIEPVLLSFSPWRLALLFFIAGVACRFLIAKRGPGGFALDRLKRLLPTILFGMFVVIPPQTYIELVARGVTHLDYFTFWTSEYLPARQTLVAPLHKTMPTWDHLWFLVYLLLYALGFALVFSLGRPLNGRHARKPILPLAVLFIAPAALLFFVNLVILKVAPITHTLVNDWGGHLKWIGMFITGALCAQREAFWEVLRRHRAAFAGVALALYLLQSHVNDPLWSAISGLYAWAMICALCGYAARYLNKPSPALAHFNEAILPVYVLHQPILLIAAYFIFPLRLALPVEGLAIAGITAFGALALYEFAIRPFAPMRFAFGLNAPRARATALTQLP